MKSSDWKDFTNGIVRENPIFRLLIGLCPALAVSTSAVDALGMGLATTFVLAASNGVISLLRTLIPPDLRIPIFIVVVSTFVTAADYLMLAFFPAIHRSLGVFVPLIVVNCIVLGRAEAFAYRNEVRASLLDGLGMGLGFSLALGLLGALREVFGAGTLFGLAVMPASYPPLLLLVLPPGAFLLIGLLIAGLNRFTRRAP
ncbi:MAG TPA: electron transport complex subunit RsxE [Elusimicrobia bacterium]|nr:electron transport complex subunit RsxE [Elusimicrobiota bacterium]